MMCLATFALLVHFLHVTSTASTAKTAVGVVARRLQVGDPPQEFVCKDDPEGHLASSGANCAMILAMGLTCSTDLNRYTGHLHANCPTARLDAICLLLVRPCAPWPKYPEPNCATWLCMMGAMRRMGRCGSKGLIR
jgi:hypothetical protein